MSGQKRYYNLGNIAVQPDDGETYAYPTGKNKQDAKYNIKKTTNKVKKPLPKRSGVFSTLFVVFLAFAAFSFIIARYSIICATGGEIDTLKKEIKTMQEEASAYSLRIAENLDMEHIQNIAGEQLKMGFPKPDQIVYVSFDDNAVAEDANSQNQVSKGENQNINVLAEIVNALE